MISYEKGYDNAYMEEGNKNPYFKTLQLDLWLDYENGFRDGKNQLEIDLDGISFDE